MNQVLIVEDSRLFSNLLKKRVAKDFQLDCVIKESYQQAVDLLAQDSSGFLLAILDLTLPGSPDGEIVDLVIEKGIPVVVVSGRMDDRTREKILAKRVLDYIMKGPHTLDLLSSTIRHYLSNQDVTILLVDDAKLVRDNTHKILATQNFKVIEADNGVTAMEKLQADPSIQLVITDYNMPKMDGFELTAEIRKSFPMDKMAIIGMSALGNPLLSAQFLKRGANDFINLPYFEEELVCRVNQNVEMLSHLQLLREAAIKDSLTELYNRRYFFQAGSTLFANARRKNLTISIAMFDIDRFKDINDNHGHACGDLVICEVAKTLQASFRAADIVARIGGDEFIVMTSNMDKAQCRGQFEKILKKVAGLIIVDDGQTIPVTVSIGVTTILTETLDAMVRQADELLYQAKGSGRNCVAID